MKELRKGMEGRLMEASQPGTWLAGASQTSLLPGPDVMAAVEIQRTKAVQPRNSIAFLGEIDYPSLGESISDLQNQSENGFFKTISSFPIVTST